MPATLACQCHRLRVLVVDDNVDIADALADLLRDEGYQVAVAYDGAQGLASFDALEPDLAIVDLGLPVLDGFKLARYIRADARFRVTPLIALSAYAAAHDRDRARKAGFDHHIAKPPEIDQLTELLSRYAGDRG